MAVCSAHSAHFSLLTFPVCVYIPTNDDMRLQPLLLIVAFCLCSTPLLGQNDPEPPGASNFIRSFGGFSTENYAPSFFDEMTHGKIDKVFAGGGPGEWTEIAGRIFLTRKWSIEIGEINESYKTYDLEAAIEASLRKQLEAEGFKLNPDTPGFASIRYQKGSTTGSVEFLSHFLSSGNLPLKLDFIFYESYLRKSTRPKPPTRSTPKKSNDKVVKGHINNELPKTPIPPPKQP